MNILEIIQQLQLPHGALAAGCIRNSVWQVLSKQPLILKSDIDLVFFDPARPQDFDRDLEHQLSKMYPTYKWQVKNEAYMHNYDFENQAAFKSLEDAIAHFVETPTSIGAYLNKEKQLKLIAPFGVDDLVNFICRPVPAFSLDQAHLIIFKRRVIQKQWCLQYPNLRILI
ncbi:hypothetical protein FC81_GL001271 [Liquorilactobacillus capillatus DSM 19910]|uniref:Nucleotidyltransferase family protein n=2 Tax=Liquorilactobacillus capillatus TaxID=480931 RepID=A0A0R1LZP8_9LACO|nr:nucleotidyltransferase family protein [Liquorilactobacillus capillatus]KRL01132.1 hypothetical protein FC81_GL001271 [Liquorilactobacillus capillatus DSM 19910]